MSTSLRETTQNPSDLTGVPIEKALQMSRRRKIFGLTADDAIRYFFRGNATISILILILIVLFLFREGAGFFPMNSANIRVYRHAGLEYVDMLRGQVDDIRALERFLNDLRSKQIKLRPEADFTAFDASVSAFSSASDAHQELLSEWTEVSSGIKERAKVNEDLEVQRQFLIAEGKVAEANAITILPVDYQKETQPLRDAFQNYQQLNIQLKGVITSSIASFPAMPSAELQPKLERFKSLSVEYLQGLDAVEKRMQAWDYDRPIAWYESVTTFIFGKQWLTASFWQDWYGIIPLFMGSLLISALSIMIAVPLSIGAAIYVNQVASSREQNLVKPSIEFISAIPSVVLGFFGVAVLGEGIRWMTGQSIFAWVPFFPIPERLNIITASCLLALMAVPTIFTLAEDALNNVPKAYVEASLALGATKFQTIVKIMVPAGLSGIISAILLGLGRVIGETMVVLLCSGGRIQIPDFSEGLGIFFQPVHTMTGIIAQEMGEVARESIHYRALFMVGIVLFFISLTLNYLAQLVVKKYKISIG